MTTIKVNKTEAARRQINMAIRMLYSLEDPVGVHTLAMAGFRILRDLASKRNDSYMEKGINSTIRSDKKSAFWQAMNSFSNFLKHADQDPDGIYDGVEEEINDATLYIACLYYQDLGHQFTPEMSVHVGWFSAIHPELLRDNNKNQKFRNSIDQLKELNRQEQLELGKKLISLARSNPNVS